MFVGLYEKSNQEDNLSVTILGYYYVTINCDVKLEQICLTLQFAGYDWPLNGIAKFIGLHQQYRIKIFTQVETPQHMYENLRNVGPWTFRTPSVISRRLRF